MRKMKRFISLLLVLGLLFTASIPAFAASVEDYEDSGAFTDEGEYAWYYDSFMLLIKNEIVNGNEGYLYPSHQLTRAEFVTLMYRLGLRSGIVEESEGAQASSDFKDVNQNRWYAKGINWAAQKGIALGVSKDRFNPKRAVTFQEMETFLFRFLTKYEVDMGLPTVFIDYEGVSDWALQAVQYFGGRRFWEGYPHKIHLKSYATRADAVYLLAKAAQVGKLL